MSDPQIPLPSLVQIVKNQAVKALLKCEPPYGGGPDAANELFNRIVEDYLDTGEYEQNRHKLRHCTPEFRQAFFRICRYDPRLATRTQIKAFLRFSRALVRKPEFVKYYQRFFRAAQAHGGFVSAVEVLHRTAWELKIERRRLPGDYAVDNNAGRFFAEYAALTNPDMPSVFRERRLRYTGRRNMPREDELAGQEPSAATTSSQQNVL